MHDSQWKKVLVFLGFLFLGFIFFRTFFLRLYWPPPYYFWKKVPGIRNTGLYFQWHFFQGLEKIRTFFQNFYFQKLFFQGLSYMNTRKHGNEEKPAVNSCRSLCFRANKKNLLEIKIWIKVVLIVLI